MGGERGECGAEQGLEGPQERPREVEPDATVLEDDLLRIKALLYWRD